MIEYSEAWKYCPDTFAFKASQGEWLPYNHVVEAFKIIHKELLKGWAKKSATLWKLHTTKGN